MPTQNKRNRQALYASARWKQYKREYYLKNKPKILGKQRLYYGAKGSEERNRILGRNRASYFKRVYGITPEIYVCFLSLQDFRCAICKTPFDKILRTSIHVDHSHKTGLVRGLLCGNCNRVLGCAKECVGRLKQTIKYIQRMKNEIRHLGTKRTHRLSGLGAETGFEPDR